MDITHGTFEILRLHTIARQHLTPWIDEEVGRACLTRQYALASLNVVDESHVEPRTEPALRVLLLQLPLNELFEVIAYLILVGDLVVVLMEIE